MSFEKSIESQYYWTGNGSVTALKTSYQVEQVSRNETENVQSERPRTKVIDN